MSLEQESRLVNERPTSPDRASGIRKTVGAFLIAAAELFSGQAHAEDIVATRPAAKEMTRNLDEEKNEILQKLDTIWKEQGSTLQKRAAALNERHDAIVKQIKSKKMIQFLHVFDKEWDPALQQFTIRNGMTLVHYHDFERKLVRLENIATRWEAWEPLKMEATNGTSEEERSAFQESLKTRRALEAKHRALLMTQQDGTVLGLYPEELEKNPTLTPDEYLDLLARVIRTPEDLAFFFRYSFEYTLDTDDIRDPLKKGSEKRSGEYWQRPDETLRRVEKKKMLGDCEDWSKFAQAMLKRWGKKSIAAKLPGHCTCIWMEQTADGRYHCYDIGTLGLTYNGCHFGIAPSGIETGVTYAAGIEAVRKGFKTMDEAIESILPKFKTHPAMQEEMKTWTFANGMTEVKHMEADGSLIETLISRTLLPTYVNLPQEEVPPPPSE